MIKVFMVCAGLGRVMRGYESFTRQAFDALSNESEFDIWLFKVGGKTSEKEVNLWNIHRYTFLARLLGKLTKTNSKYIDEASFFLSLLPQINRHKPDIIYFSDDDIGNMLWHWRRLTGQNYKLLLANGGPISLDNPVFSRCDLIQQIAPKHLNAALQAGIPAHKQNLVTYGYQVPPELTIISPAERNALKQKLGLPIGQPLILSVGAINKSHKRMDYLIREVANLTQLRPYLLLLGEFEHDTKELINLGKELLGNNSFKAKCVPQNDVIDYYKVADIFVLASINEGLGRVLLEAMSYGLPCLTHDHPVARFVLGDEGYYGDLTRSGSLSKLIVQVLAEEQDLSKCYQRHLSIYERFSWEKLRPLYVKMIQKCAYSQ